MSIAVEEPKARSFRPEDLLDLPDGGRGFELVGGELREVEVSFMSAYVAGRVYGAIRDHVSPKRLGWVTPEGTAFRCFPDPRTVRKADTAFHLLSRVTAEQAMSEGFCSIVPDIVVEVVSPNDLGKDIEEKRLDWLDAGVKLQWVVYPDSQTVQVWHADGRMQALKRADTLSGDPVLPEFSVPVMELFQLPTDPVAS